MYDLWWGRGLMDSGPCGWIAPGRLTATFSHSSVTPQRDIHNRLQQIKTATVHHLGSRKCCRLPSTDGSLLGTGGAEVLSRRDQGAAWTIYPPAYLPPCLPVTTCWELATLICHVGIGYRIVTSTANLPDTFRMWHIDRTK